MPSVAAPAHQPATPRRLPQRTCVGCRETTTKRALVRVVRTPEGRVAPDPSGKSHGRGAYIHADPACWRKALARVALGRALRTDIAPEDRMMLEAYAATLRAAGPTEP